jgi:peptidoglycan hydrolase CwlO-like protein
MDLNTTTITVSSIFLIVAIFLSVFSFVNNNKKDIQLKASDYAVYKSKVQSLEKEVSELKQDIKSTSKELREEVKRLDEQILTKIEEIKDLIIDKLKL